MQGTFITCSNCKERTNCCNDFNNIDNPILSNFEKQTIQKQSNCPETNFQKISKDGYVIKTQNGKCPFYNNHCTIYSFRPNDCKLYPYDIKRINGTYYLIKYKLKCLSNNILNEDVDEIINNINPYISTFVDELYNKKLSNQEYEIIKEIVL